MPSPLLAAVLIVRDEAEMLPACLQSLRGVVDQVHVLDTGSVDGTPELARGHGAEVRLGSWAGDFAAARNAAVADCAATWVLAVDADHRVTADPEALRAFLRTTTAEAVLVEIDDRHHANPYRQLETRLYRPAALSWSGRVHERLIRPDGPPEDLATVPAGVLELRHLGHATHPDRIRRAERNIKVGRAVLGEVGAGTDRERVAHTLLALGRDYAAAEHRQAAVDTFEALRELFPGTPEWLAATDALARLVLAAGYDKVCLVLVEQLRAAGAPAPFCDWLAAQAYAQIGDPDTAARLLAGVPEVVDTTGRHYDPAALDELRTMVDRLAALTSPG